MRDTMIMLKINHEEQAQADYGSQGYQVAMGSHWVYCAIKEGGWLRLIQEGL
jgi:hypothetical protein